MKSIDQNGFTLIELMITVAIVGILAAIAYPSYQEQVRHSRRSDCAGALVGLASAMERKFTLDGSYSIPAPTLGNVAGAIYTNQCPLDGGAATYTLRFFALAANTYTIEAIPAGPQAGDKCATLRLTNTGVKSTTSGLTVQECW